jgi:type VI protein secretion system component VasK
VDAGGIRVKRHDWGARRAMTFLDYMLWFFWIWLVVACIWLFVWIIIDVFRDHSLNGWAKAGWLILLVILPFLGALIYVIARGRSMAQRRASEAQEAASAQAQYIRDVAGSSSPTSEIERAQALLANGTITQAEFDGLKAKALAS